MHVGGVEPLQGLHDDLLENKRTQHTFGCSHTELVDVVDSWGRRRGGEEKGGEERGGER